MTNPALTYESKAVPTVFGPWAAALVEAMAPREVADGEGVMLELHQWRIQSLPFPDARFPNA